MSQIMLSAVASILAVLLPMIGVTLGSEQLTAFVQTVVIIGSSLWIYIRRYNMGGVSFSGLRE